jgi:Ni/Co efflux regulator RcnB
MRRLISLLAAVLVVATPLATAGGAVAEGHHEGRGGGGGGGGGDGHWASPSRAGPPAGYRGGGEFRGGEFRGGGRDEGFEPRNFPRNEPRNDPRGDPRGYSRGEYRSEPRPDPRYDPRAYGAPPSAYRAAPRRGGYLGRQYGGEVIQDYGRFRLRPPPRGYEWVRTPNGMAMVSTMTGQVFDVVPY